MNLARPPSGLAAALGRTGLYAGAFLGPFGAGLTVAMLPELAASFGVSPGTASLSVTAYFLPFAAVMLFSGTLGERWGGRRTVVGAYAGYVLASAACILAPTLPLFLAARALQGVANAFTTPLLLSAVAATVPAQRLGRALGWFGALQAAGQTSAPLLGGFAAELDWRLAFGGAAVVAAALAVIGIPGDAVPERPPDGIGAALRTALQPVVLRAGVAAALGWGCLAGLNFLVALRLEDAFAVGAGPRGLVLTGLGVAGLLTARLVGGGVDRIGARRIVLLGAEMGALVVVGVGMLPNVWLVALAWAVGGVATQLVLVGVNAMILGAVERGRGGAVSVVQAVRFGGGALSPVAITPIYHADPLVGFLVPAALLGLAVPAALPRGRG
jgi:MFS family permease